MLNLKQEHRCHRHPESREQYDDATDENGLKYKLPEIVATLINGLDAFYLNRLIQLNEFLSLVLDTLFMVSSPSLIEKFPGGVFSNQRPLSSENSNSALAFSRLAFSMFNCSHFSSWLLRCNV